MFLKNSVAGACMFLICNFFICASEIGSFYAKETQKESTWRVMQDFQFPILESLKLNLNQLTPYERLLMAHLMSMHALILSMQALESEGKLLPQAYMPQANRGYLSLERELLKANKQTVYAKLLRQDIDTLTKLYAQINKDSPTPLPFKVRK